MKTELLVIFIVLLFGSKLHSQEVIFSEDFENGIPDTWTQSMENGSDGWKAGTPTSLQSTYFEISTKNKTKIVATNDDKCQCDKSHDLLKTPPMDLSKYKNLFLYFDVYFEKKCMLEMVYENLLLKVSTDGGDSWKDLCSIWGDYKWHTVAVDVSEYTGGNNKNIVFAWEYSDKLKELFGAALDNIKLVIPVDYDINMLSIDIPFPIYGLNNAPLHFKGKLVNNGSNKIKSFVINYTINGGTPVSATIDGINIPPLGIYEYTHPLAWTPPSSAKYEVKVFITKINGNNDKLQANDTLSKSIEIIPKAVKRLPLYEHFTSNSCNPCVFWNTLFLQPLLDSNDVNSDNNPGLAAIKYQLDFPGKADQSFNPDVATRKLFTGIHSIPQTVINGVVKQFPTQEGLNKAKLLPAYLEITGTAKANTTNNYLEVSVTLNPLKDLGTNNILQIAVVEDSYNNTKGNNGETDFYQVLRKLLPNGNGTLVDLSSGKVTHSESYTFTVGNVNTGNYNLWKGLDNCHIVVFVQNQVGKEILQAKVLPISLISDIKEEISIDNPIDIFPNPAKDVVSISLAKCNDLSKISISIMNTLGQIVYAGSLQPSNDKHFTINISDIATGVYYINVNVDSKMFSKKFVVIK